MKDLGLDGRIILRWICKTWDEGTDWIDMTQVPYNAGISWLAENLLTSYEGLCSMELVS
jgi:hypothetical protein